MTNIKFSVTENISIAYVTIHVDFLAVCIRLVHCNATLTEAIFTAFSGQLVRGLQTECIVMVITTCLHVTSSLQQDALF